MHRVSRRAAAAPLIAVTLTVAASCVLPSAHAATTVIRQHATATTTRPAPQRIAAATRAAAHRASLHRDRTAVTVEDLSNGHTWSAGSHGTFGTASVVKTLIAAKILYTGNMRGDTADLAYRMITRSDDTAATILWNRFGGPSIITDIEQHYNIHVGTPNRRPGYWGNTQVTSRGLAAFYRATYQDKPVWRWLYHAMTHTQRIASDGTNQYFGIPAAGAGHTVKQGWGTHSAGNGYSSKSTVNSTGIITDHGHPYAVVILTEGDSNAHADARGLNRRLARVVTQQARTLLHGGTLPV